MPRTSPPGCVIFYRATVQYVLLYGSKTWNLALAALTMMEGFHVHSAHRMTGMMPRKRGNVWIYPKSREVLKAVGLHTVELYGTTVDGSQGGYPTAHI